MNSISLSSVFEKKVKNILLSEQALAELWNKITVEIHLKNADIYLQNWNYSAGNTVRRLAEKIMRHYEQGSFAARNRLQSYEK